MTGQKTSVKTRTSSPAFRKRKQPGTRWGTRSVSKHFLYQLDNQMKNFPLPRYVLLAAIFAIGFAAACSSTEQTRKGDERPEKETIPEFTESTRENLTALLTRTRNRLSDVHFTQQHDVPEAFLKVDTTDNSYNNPFEGYRIQILSSRDVTIADSVSTQFRLWADTTLAGYTPKAYVFFKQPYYKVHVGDFQSRDKANNLSRIIKRKYPEAWVVHDRIDPGNVPADTAKIRMQEVGKATEEQ